MNKNKQIHFWSSKKLKEQYIQEEIKDLKDTLPYKADELFYSQRIEFLRYTLSLKYQLIKLFKNIKASIFKWIIKEWKWLVNIILVLITILISILTYCK